MKRQEEFVKGKVSIVTPVFNGEAYLPQMLDSVLAQTYQHVEMILVDDGSTDGTPRIAERYREKFEARGYEYRLIQASHKNASAAINRGLPYVRGEFLIWPDSDDVLEPESIEKRVAFLQENPTYNCVRSLPYYFDAETGGSMERGERQGDLSDEALFWNILEAKTYVSCGCYMLRSHCFFAIYQDRHIPEYEVGQNFQMLLPFMYHHKCPTIREKLYGVCVRRDSHSRKALTETEEGNRYAGFEDLIDDIAAICEINDQESKNRIMRWKLGRRCNLSLKYDRKERAIKAIWQMHKVEGSKGTKLIEAFLWVFIRNTWMGRVLRQALKLFKG